MGSNVLIAGCGGVGCALAVKLMQHGHQVWGMRRDVSALPAGVRAWQADLSDPKSLGAPPSTFNYLFYTAAAGERTEARYRSIYVEGLRAVIGLLVEADAPIRRALFTSSTAVYGQHDGGWVNESSPTEPSSFSGQILLEAEAVLAASPWPSTNVRLAGIYGPGRIRLIETVYRGRAQGSTSYTNRIHVQDCAGALAHLMHVDDPAPLYIGVDDAPAPFVEVASWIAKRIGVEPPSPDQGVALGRGTNKRCSNGALKSTGYELAFPTYRDGYAPMLEAYLKESRGDT